MGTRGPVPKHSSQRRRRNRESKPATSPAGSPVRAGVDEPPRSGQGATTVAWSRYASQIGIDVPAGAGRNHIIDLVDSAGVVSVDGPDPKWHPLAAGWFESLAKSGQSRWYEASDWATARILAHTLSGALDQDRIFAASIEVWMRGAAELLTTEGTRRRMRVELERGEIEDPDDAAAVAWLDEWRDRHEAG